MLVIAIVLMRKLRRKQLFVQLIFLLAFSTGSVYFVDWQNTSADFYRISRSSQNLVQRLTRVERMQCFLKWNRCLNEFE